MKKLFYTLLIFFTCFIGINRVSALKPDSYYNCDYNPELCSSGTNISAYGSLGGTFFGYPFGGRKKVVQFNYNDVSSYLTDNHRYYNLNFSFFSNQIKSLGLYDVAFTANGKLCEYGNASLITEIQYSDQEEYLYFYNAEHFVVSCENVDLQNNSLHIAFYQLPNNPNDQTGGEIAIAENIYFSVGSLSSIGQQQDVVDSINQQVEKIDEQNQLIEDTNNTLKDDNVDESTSEATEFFEGFDTNTYGLTSIITAPLELIGNIAGSTCSPLQVPLPFVGTNLSLPCMSTIYKQYFGNFLTIYQTITFGIVAYWVCIRIFALVKDFKNPEHDEIEVMDL